MIGVFRIVAEQFGGPAGLSTLSAATSKNERPLKTFEHISFTNWIFSTHTSGTSSSEQAFHHIGFAIPHNEKQNASLSLSEENLPQYKKESPDFYAEI